MWGRVSRGGAPGPLRWGAWENGEVEALPKGEGGYSAPNPPGSARLALARLPVFQDALEIQIF